MSKKKFRKSIESIRHQILIHYQKIANEEQKETPAQALINYWKREIIGLEKSLSRQKNT